MSQFLFRLSPVSVSFKMEPQLGDVVVELAPEAPLVDVLPLLVDNLEGDVLVGGTGGDVEDAEVAVLENKNNENVFGEMRYY